MKNKILIGIIALSIVLTSYAAFAEENSVPADQTQTTVEQSTTSTTEATSSANTSTDVNTTTQTSTSTEAAPTTEVTPPAQETQPDPTAPVDEFLKGVDPTAVEFLRNNNVSLDRMIFIIKLSQKSGKSVQDIYSMLKEDKSLLKASLTAGLKFEDYRTIQQEVSKIMKAVNDAERELAKNEPAREVVKGIDPQVIEALRGKGLGYGQIAIISALAQKSGKTIDEVVAIYEKDQDLGKVAQELGIKVGDAMRAKKAVELKEKLALKKAEILQKRQETIDKAKDKAKEEVKKAEDKAKEELKKEDKKQEMLDKVKQKLEEKRQERLNKSKEDQEDESLNENKDEELKDEQQNKDVKDKSEFRKQIIEKAKERAHGKNK